MKKQLSLIIPCLFAHLFGQEGVYCFSDDPCIGPWFTGPLLTPSGHVVPVEYVDYEPYLFYITETGVYDDDWKSINTPDFIRNQYQLPVWIGLTKWMDIELIGSATWQSFKGVSSLVFNDFHVELDFQLLEDTHQNRLPGLKFYVGESFPTGRYQKLNPDKLGTDNGGDGSYQTTFGFVITRTFEFPRCHYLAVRVNPFVTLSTSVDVKGLNAFGGAFDTDAKIKPPTTCGLLFGLEYNLTQNWALAFDGKSIYETKRSFSRFPGTGPNREPLDFNIPAGFQFSVAPAIEYNLSAEMGFVGGLWFTVAGKNQPRFFGGGIAFNYFGHTAKGDHHRYRTSGGGAGGR